MYCVDIVAKILFLGLLLWTLFNWSDGILAFGLGLVNVVRLFFGAVLSAVAGGAAAEPLPNDEL